MESRSLKPLKLVAMILAGGRVGELSVLTLRRPKSALPFAGYYRIIDFPLSNLMRAGITNVGILSQYRLASLIDHVGVGESWDFVGLGRGAKILPPYRGAEASDWYRGNADAVYQNLNYVRDHDADMVLILSGDHVYSMDYTALIEAHLGNGADLTVAVKRMDPHARFGYAVLDPDGRMTEYQEKPARPRSDLGSLTIYLANTEPLQRVLTELNSRDLHEFGRDVIPAMLERYRVFGWEFRDYWAYSRTVEAYYQAHQDLLEGHIDMDAWGIRSNLNDALIAGQPPMHGRSGGRIEHAFVSSGCQVDGEVRDSVLSPGVVVEQGASVAGSVIFSRCVVERGARVERCILDKGVTVGRDAQVGSKDENVLTLVGKEALIAARSRIQAGATIQPDERVSGPRPSGDRS